MSIYVTKPYLPPKEEFIKKISEIYERDVLTNYGPEAKELERRLKNYLDVENFQFVTNGTIALQIALKALDINDGEIITTPFSYVATTSSILWERCDPVFVDIEPDNFTIDVSKIEEAITDRTKAIMPVHVFGYACNVNEIENIARKYGLKVIYDAAHSFGSRYDGKSLCSFGDISTLSFHATKLFHTIEGGACIVKDKKIAEKLDLIRRFGHNGDEHISLGINAKQDELNAAMGLCNLNHIEEIISFRKKISEIYDSFFKNKVKLPKKQNKLEYNYAYYPVVFESEEELLDVFERLSKIEVFPRRYFYPSLNNLPYLNKSQVCPVSEFISKRIACLPLYYGLEEEIVEKICKTIIRI